MGWLISVFALTSSPIAHAAPIVIFSSIGSSGCVNAYGSNNNINSMKFRATSDFSANIVRVPIGTQTQANFRSSSFYIMSNNSAGGTVGQGTPGNTLAIFLPDTITGTGVNTIATYVGNISITNGTYFWMVFGNRASVTSHCWTYLNSTADLVMNSASVDTTTSLSNTQWLRAQTTVDTSPVNATWSIIRNQNLAYQFSLENSIIPQVSISLSGPSGATYKSNSILTVTVDSESRVTFYANQKPISGCRNVLSSGGSATCSWKPALHGGNLVYASAIPTNDSYLSNNSSVLSIGVGKRTNKR